MRKNSKQFANNNNNSVGNVNANVNGSRRAAKTLGWFMSEELLGKTGVTAAAAAAASSSPSPPVLPKFAAADKDEKHRKRRGGRRARKLTESLSTASETSLPLDVDEEVKKLDTSAPLSAGIIASDKDFYVYDVQSDGYYYEQNGAKGWRRRLPNGVQAQKPKTPVAPAAAVQPQTTPPILDQETSRAVSSMAALGLSIFGNTAYNRYYDASSDGYYFEMASVDGWRKRSTAPPTAAAGGPTASNAAAGHYRNAAAPRGPAPGMFYSPHGMVGMMHQPAPSYGAALARGEMPAKCVIESSASSSVSDDLSYPTLSRPTSLDYMSAPSFTDSLSDDNCGGNGRLFPTWDSSKFIEELVGQFSSSHLEALNTTSTPQTPANSIWSRRARLDAPEGTTAPFDADEDYLLTKELEKIWQTPTPIAP